MWCTTAASGVLGSDHETAEFAVESIRRWWRSIGSGLYPTSQELLIMADGGGSNGARNRLWKMQLQRFATETGLSITVCHLPPATSNMEYDRAPTLFLHFHQLAGQTVNVF